jgi:hypothetical protein
MRLSDALREHARQIESTGLPTALSRDLVRAAEQIEWLEAATNGTPSTGEGPSLMRETDHCEEHRATMDRRLRQKTDEMARAIWIKQLSRSHPQKTF